MNPIQITVPPGSEISNYLYPSLTIDDLTQDMVTVQLPNGYSIDAGWYPEHDPNGRFVVRVFQGYWDNQKLPKPILEKNVSVLVFIIEKLAEHFSRSQIPSLKSSSERKSVTIPSHHGILSGA